jgi:hypothetical protein
LVSSESGCVVRHERSPISTGMTASVPYVSRNGVSPVVECGVVLYAQSTLQSSSTHFFFSSSSLRFSPLKITLLAASACPLV